MHWLPCRLRYELVQALLFLLRFWAWRSGKAAVTTKVKLRYTLLWDMRIPSATQSWVKVTSHLPLHPRRVLHMKVFERGHFTAMLARSPETTEFSAGVWKNALTPLHVILNQPNFWPSICICLTCFLTYKLAWKHAFKTQNRLFGAIRKLNQPQNLPTKQVDGGWVQFLEPRLRVLFVLLLLLFIGKSALHLLEKTLRFPATTAIQHVIRCGAVHFFLSLSSFVCWFATKN